MNVIDTSGWPSYGGDRLSILRRLRSEGIRLVAGDFEYLAEADGLYTCWKPGCGPAGNIHEARLCPA